MRQQALLQLAMSYKLYCSLAMKPQASLLWPQIDKLYYNLPQSDKLYYNLATKQQLY